MQTSAAARLKCLKSRHYDVGLFFARNVRARHLPEGGEGAVPVCSEPAQKINA
jgi:hypothetical protein